MYLEYYSLERPPFRITPDPSLFYTGGANGRGVVLEALLYAISSGEGILKVVGEVGSGKTMLCRMLEERLPESVEIVYLANPNLSPHDILYAIAFELKLPVDHSTQRLVLMQHLQEYLLQQHAANKSVLVIIEEAQSMPLETLEEVRLFSNLETHQHKLMQIVLFGQPELDKNLQDKSIRQLRERITHSFDLRPLNLEEVRDYIRYRLQAAGCPAPQVFDAGAEKLIAKASGGLTRRINILADKAMLAAYSESATALRPRSVGHSLKPAVLARHVKAAIKDSGYYQPKWRQPGLWITLALLLSLLVLGTVWWLSARNASPVLAAHVPDAVVALSAPAVADSATVSPSLLPSEIPVTVSEVVADAAVEARQQAPGNELSGSVVPAAAEPLSVNANLVPELSQDLLAEGRPESSVQAPVPGAEQFSANGLGWLAMRTRASESWLEASDQDAYTVQLLSVARIDAAYVDYYVNYVLGRLYGTEFWDNTHACISQMNGVDYWKVVYGEFGSVEQARALIPVLPTVLRNNSPFVQSIRRLDCGSFGGRG